MLAVFFPSATIGLVEITGVTGCLGLELGLGCLTVFSAVASPGFVEITGVKGWLGLGLLGDVAVGLAFFGVAAQTGLGLLFGDAVCSGVALPVVVPLKRSGNTSVANS